MQMRCHASAKAAKPPLTQEKAASARICSILGARSFMLRFVLLVLAVIGLSSPSFAAQPSLFDGMFKKSTSSKSSLSFGSPRSVDGPVSITVDITTQVMKVSSEGRTIYTFDVSTGRKGYTTPTGNYRPIRMHKMWYSSKY